MSQSGAPGAKETEPEVVADESELERFEPDGEAGRPKRLPLALPRAAPPELVPARTLSDVVYCERSAVLEWAQTEFADDFFTVEGRTVHAGGRALGRQRKSARGADGDEKSDGEQKEESAPDGAPEETTDAQAPGDGSAADRPYTARSVWLSS